MIKESFSRKCFNVFNVILMLAIVVLMVFPYLHVLAKALNDGADTARGGITIFPRVFTLENFKTVIEDSAFPRAFMVSVSRVILGTIISVMIQFMAAYAFMKKDLAGRGILKVILLIPMYFGGGAIPLFLVIKELGLLDTRLIMILLGSVSVSNVIMVRSFMYTNIPEELFDAAIMDGCGHGKFLVRIVLPLSKAIMSVMVLYLAVGYWNSYFNAMMFITDPNKYPLQLFLRRTLLLSSTLSQDKEILDPDYLSELLQRASVIKYSIIVVATAPILCVYPFIQKYFVKGVTIGAVKG